MLALYVVTAQKQLAMDTGYDPRTIRRVELGECCPSAEFMFEMSDYFGVPIEEIFALKKTKDIEEIMHGRWAHMDEFDQDEWLEHLEEHLKEIVNISGKDVHTLAADIEMHRREVHERIAREHPELAERFAQRRHLLDKHLKERRPEVYRIIVQLREDNKHK